MSINYTYLGASATIDLSLFYTYSLLNFSSENSRRGTEDTWAKEFRGTLWERFTRKE
jgi:hypothetical protein